MENTEIAKLLKEIEEEFFSSLDQKTGWGKEEVKRAYKDAVLEVLMRKVKV